MLECFDLLYTRLLCLSPLGQHLHLLITDLYLMDFFVDDEAVDLVSKRQALVLLDGVLRADSSLVLFGLSLQLLELGDRFTSLLEGVFVVLFALSEKQILCDVWQELADERVVHKVKQLWLDLRSEDHVELGDIADFFLISNRHFVLFRFYVLGIPLDRAISLQRLDLGENGIEPLFKVEVRLGREDKGTRFILNFEDVVARVAILNVGR